MVDANVNVLDSVGEGGRATEVDAGHVVFANLGRLLLRITKLLEKATTILNIGATRTCAVELGFTGGKTDGLLADRRPGDCCAVEDETVACDAASAIGVSGMISIRKS